MRRVAALAAALMFLAACGDDDPPTSPTNPNTAPIAFTVQLSAANEVPPITNSEANGRGTATITLNVPRNPTTGAITDGGTVNFSVQVSGFPNGTPLNMAHIHTGAPGTIGDVLVATDLTPTTPVVLAAGSGSFSRAGIPIDQATAQIITANPGSHYLNVHTTVNPTGAIRGQLTR